MEIENVIDIDIENTIDIEVDVDIENTVGIEVESLVDIEVDAEQIGPQGLSAYEVYIQNGGSLTEKEWLDSLKGETGPQGPQGEPGKDCEINLDEYYTKDEVDAAISVAIIGALEGVY